MAETLQLSSHTEIPDTNVPDFARERHPDVERIYELLPHHYNAGYDDGWAFARCVSDAGSADTPDKGSLDALRIGTGYGDRLVLEDVKTVWTPPMPDDKRSQRKTLAQSVTQGLTLGLTEDWRTIKTPYGYLAEATDVEEYYNLEEEKTQYQISGSRWQFESVEALLRGEYTVSVSPYARFAGQTIPIPGKNRTPNKFPTHPSGRTSKVKSFHRVDGSTHEWLLLDEAPGRIPNIEQTVAIPKKAWNEDNSGTGSPLVWIDQHNAIAFQHGYKRNVSGVEFYYSVGWGWVRVNPVTGRVSMPYVDPRPLVTPHTLGDKGELHPGLRKVAYTCGAQAVRDPKHNVIQKVDLFVNRGDESTDVVEINPTRMLRLIKEVLKIEERLAAIGRTSLRASQVTYLN